MRGDGAISSRNSRGIGAATCLGHGGHGVVARPVQHVTAVLEQLLGLLVGVVSQTLVVRRLLVVARRPGRVSLPVVPLSLVVRIDGCLRLGLGDRDDAGVGFDRLRHTAGLF